MSIEQLPQFVQFLLKKEAYPHSVDDVTLIQTHISYVFLAGDFVYKFKKPLDFGFLDFTTLEKRKYFCEQELLLNRRLCPAIYLDVVSLNQNTALSLNGQGVPVEYGVKMKRMPSEGMMGKIIKSGKLTREMIRGIVDILTPFYARAEQIDPPYGTIEFIGKNVLENLEQVKPYIGEVMKDKHFNQIISYARNFLRNEKLFIKRVEEKRIRDCHGDLYSANICIADEIYIYDCIEFNTRFRYIDIASDIAFLAMDLDFHGLNDLSDYFIDLFMETSGDTGVREVLDFYKCYRAAVRGKIGLLTEHEPEIDDETRLQSISLAQKYFQLALQYATN